MAVKYSYPVPLIFTYVLQIPFFVPISLNSILKISEYRNFVLALRQCIKKHIHITIISYSTGKLDGFVYIII